MKYPLFHTQLCVMLVLSLSLFSCEEDPVGPVLGENLISLNLDSDNQDAPSLPANSYEAAVRFPASQMGQYAGDRLTEANFFIQTVPQSCELRIYVKSDNNAPDSLVYSANVRSALRANSWNKHTLTTPYSLTGEDVWITLSFAHTNEQRTVGCDQGPARTNGDWLLDAADNQWIPLSQRSPININWNIRGAIDPQ